MEHTSHLAAHDAAHFHIALQHGPAQAAQGDLLQLLQRGAALLQGQILPGHLVLQGSDRAADGAAGDHRITVLGLQHSLLVIGVDGALLAGKQTGAHLDAAGKGRSRLTAVRDAAGRHHGNAYRIDDLGHQGHGGHLAHVAAGLRALGDDGVHAIALQPLGQNRRRHYGHHLDALFLPGGNVLAGIAGAGGDHFHALF